MFKLSIACPDHGLPYEHVVIAENNPHYLRCRECPFEPTSMRIGSEQDYMKARMGQEKTKQREKAKSKSKSRSKEKSKSKDKSKSRQKERRADDQEQQEQMIIIQKIAEQQVRTLELVMKLLTEDKKKYYEHLQKSLSEHKKLWSQYDESTRDIIFMDKICKGNLLGLYMGVLGERGWAGFKDVLKRLHGRSYVSKKIAKESKEIAEMLRKEGKIGEDTVLKTLETVLAKHKVIEKQSQTAAIVSKEQVKGNKRSKSFNGR